jgi:flagellar hook-length control protein FliK
MRDSTWTSQLVDTISVHDFGDGQTLDIQLTPETLGRLKITMEMRDGQAMVSVVTDNPEAARLFNDNQSRLADVMAKAGLTLASHDAGTGAQSGGSGDNAQGDGSVLTASGADTQTQTEEDVIMKVGGEQPQVNVVA